MNSKTNFSKFCSVCFDCKPTLTSATNNDSNNSTWLTKLSLCVPQVHWKQDDLICDACIEQLEIVDAFRIMCIRTENLRKEQESTLLQETNTDVICFHCDRTFDSKSNLILHIQQIHQINPNANEHIEQNTNYTCETCHKCYKNLSLFKKHSRLCNKRIQSHTNETDLVKQQNDDNFGCFVPTNRTQELPPLNVQNEDCRRVTAFPCELCLEVFSTAKKLITHAFAVHKIDAKSVRPYSCDKCDSKFYKSSNLLQHKMYHQKKRTNICSFCGKGFITKNDLRVHEKQHLNKREYSCEFCPKNFNTHKDLRSHKLVVHTDPSTWNHVCSVCNKRFPIKSNYDQHMRRHTGDKRFACHICEKRFIDKVVLQKHIISHSNVRPFKCDHCDKEYKHKRIRDVHLAQAHGIGNAKVPVRVKKHFCHICPKSYFAKNKLTRHMCVHTGERPFSCDFCKKTFTDRSYVKQHLKNAHNVCESEENP